MNPAPRESSRLVPTVVLLAVMVFTALVAHTMRIPPPTDRDGGTYRGQLPDGRELRIHRFVESEGDPWDRWVDSSSGTWAVRDTSTGELWGPASLQWGSNTVVEFQPAADGASGIASLTPTGPAGSSSPHRSMTTVLLTREFRHRGAASRFGIRLGNYGAEIKALAQLPAFDTSTPFARDVSDHLWLTAREAMREFMSQRWEQQWDAVRWNWPATLSSWDLDWQAQPRLWRSNLVSVAVFWYPDRGGNGDPTHWRGITLLGDDRQCIPLVWDDLFREESGWMAFLKERCSVELSHHLNHETVVDDIPTDNFTLTTHGLQLLFDPYTVASGAEGAQVVHIPWTNLYPFLLPPTTTHPNEKTLPRPIAELIAPILP